MADPAWAVRAARVVTPQGTVAATVWIADGQIVRVAGIDEPFGDAPVVQLAADEVLLPGLVDTHVHINEPGRTEWEGFTTATRAAAAGGVTTVLDMPLNCVPPTITPKALETKRVAAAGQCWVDVGFWGGAIPASLGGLRDVWAAGTFGFKCFLVDSGVLEFPHLSTAELRTAMTEIAAFGGQLIVHAEDPDLVASGDLHSRHYADFLATRPSASEVTAISTLITAMRATGCRTHIVHLSSAEALPQIAAAKAEGLPLTVETCPHYLTLAAEDVPEGATQFKCCPPVRGQDNAERLWDGLADGAINFIASDHSPSTPDLKSLDDGDFGAAWGGISSLQLGLPLIWTAARHRGRRLEDVVRWMAANPAQTMGVPGKGVIAAGHDADLVVFAPDETWTVDASRLHHRHAVSPYGGRELQGVVRSTYLRGRLVEVDGRPHGRLLTRRVTRIGD